MPLNQFLEKGKEVSKNFYVVWIPVIVKDIRSLNLHNVKTQR